MKKVVIFLVLLSCSTNDDVQIQTEPTTIPTNTTVFTAMDPVAAVRFATRVSIDVSEDG